MWLVVKRDNEQKRDVCINADGSTELDPRKAELFSTLDDAKDVAATYGGNPISECRLFPEED